MDDFTPTQAKKASKTVFLKLFDGSDFAAVITRSEPRGFK
jgi:hypothetical protein